jgi:hypothetical protein
MRRIVRRVAAGLVAILAGVAVGPACARAVDLQGTWYVLVHSQDKDSAHPEAWRWEDRVWRFQRQGDRLEWTEWPIVVFDDESGRFENLGGSHAARVLSAWEPSPAQLENVHAGLQVNPRGSKTKTLRTEDDGRSWASSEAPAGGSALVITYSEHWSIEGLPDQPAFVRVDSLGAATSESMQGRTEYRTTEVGSDGTLHGTFERDGTRVGTFEMMRSGEIQKLKGSGLTQSQRLMQMFASEAGLTLNADQIRALTAGKVAPGAEVPTGLRAEVRARIRTSVEEAVRQQGEDPRNMSAQVDALTRKIEHLILDEGKSVEDVQQMLKRGEVVP